MMVFTRFALIVSEISNMEDSFKTYMTSRSDLELNNYLTNAKTYTPEAVNAAIAELEQRGRTFTEDELEPVKSIIKHKLEERFKSEKDVPSFIANKNITDDHDSPLLYSNRAVYFFSIFFSVIFGAVLLAVNLWDNKSARWNIMGFGIAYTTAAIILSQQLEITSVWAVVINAFGGSILTGYFWNKYIGKTVKYKSKPVWKPLIISIIVSLPFAAAMLYNMAEKA